MTPKEQEIFAQATKTIKEQQAQLEQLTAPVYQVGTIVEVYEKTAVVDVNNARFECDLVNKTMVIDKSWIGCTVNVHPKTGQLVRKSSFVSYGSTATVSQIEKGLIVLNMAQGTFTTAFTQVPIETLSPGDHVVMNSSNVVVMKKLELKSKYASTPQAPLDWKDIGGCTEAKAELRKALELPYTNPQVFEFFHKKRMKGGVLWGRPGNGKTLIGRACAGAIARIHKAESVDTGFIYIKGPEILSKWVGEPEEAVRTLFDHARLHFKKYGYPAIIFVDEADAILTRRGTRTAAGMEQTIVPMFNAEMDGMDDSGAFVLLATNRVEILDPAIIRPGRIDRKFYIGPPTLETAPEVFGIHMRDVPVSGCDKEQLIKTVTEALFGDKFPLYKLETNKGDRVFNLAHIASGAMIAGLVERATSYAIDRNLDNPKPDGVSVEDFNIALDSVHKEQFGLNHFDELREFVELEKVEVTGIAPCHTAAELALPVPKRESGTPQIIAVVDNRPTTSITNLVKKDPSKYDA